MDTKREQALVGLFVLVAAALLAGTLFALSGAFRRHTVAYRAYFPYAGGLEPGATVRYAGGPRVGRVETLRIDPQDPRRLEIRFSVDPDLPVKTDSVAKILSLSPLGENYLDISPGNAQASRAPAGAVLPSVPYVGFNELTAQLNSLGPGSKQLIDTLNHRATELQVTLARINDVLGESNRANLAASLSNVRGMLEEDRPKIKAALGQVETASAKLGPLLDEFHKTAQQADQTLAHVDGMVGDNRPDVRAAVAELRRTLASMESVAGQLDRTLNVNSENIDELLDNLRHVTENLKAFTATIKTRPYTLIRASAPPEHKTGAPK